MKKLECQECGRFVSTNVPRATAVTGILLCPGCFNLVTNLKVQGVAKGGLSELDMALLNLGGEFMRVVMVANQVGAQTVAAAQEEVDGLSDELSKNQEKLKGLNDGQRQDSDRCSGDSAPEGDR